MVAIVPRDFPFPGRAGIASRKPVRGVHLMPVASALNYLRAYGTVVLPAMRLAPFVPPSTTYTFSGIFPLKTTTRHLVWYIEPRVDSGVGELTFTEDSGGTITRRILTSVPSRRRISTGFFHVESLSGAPANPYTGGIRSWTLGQSAAATADVYIDTIACFALPRETLLLDTDDVGLDVDTLRPDLPIFDDAYYSIGGISRALVAGEDTTTNGYGTRALFAWARAQGQGITVTGGTFTDIFDEGPVIQPHHRFTAETLRACYANASGWTDAATTMEVRFTAASGDTFTKTIAYASSGSWGFPGQIDCYAEDLSAADGRRASTDEIVTIAARISAGAGNGYLEGLSIIDSNL